MNKEAKGLEAIFKEKLKGKCLLSSHGKSMNKFLILTFLTAGMILSMHSFAATNANYSIIVDKRINNQDTLGNPDNGVQVGKWFKDTDTARQNEILNLTLDNVTSDLVNRCFSKNDTAYNKLAYKILYARGNIDFDEMIHDFFLVVLDKPSTPLSIVVQRYLLKVVKNVSDAQADSVKKAN